jgi:predicted patatin/cPLA2 family phospholipase
MRLSSLRHFARDPLLGPTPTGPDQRDHPVIAALHERRREGSRPGQRTDGRQIALVIEGGGMRGVVSAGMTAAIEQLGLTAAFDEVHGASAGAFNAAFLLSGQATYLTGLYPHGFGDPRFARIAPTVIGRPLFDLDYVVNDVWRNQRPLSTDRIIESEIELHCTATDVDTATLVDLVDLHTDEEIRTALRASARLPWLAGPPVHFRGHRLLDATLSEAIPVTAARRTATDILVLQTRPHGVPHRPLSKAVARLTDRYLEKLNPALVELRRTRTERYDRLSSELATQAAADAVNAGDHPDGASSGELRICVVRPPSGTPTIGQMENRQAKLAAAGSRGLRAAWMALQGEEPELLSIPHAFPSSTL